MSKSKMRRRRCGDEGGCQVTGRGPNWLFVRVSRQQSATTHELIEQLWQHSQRHFTNRLVVEFDSRQPPARRRAEIAALGAELRELHQRLSQSGGALRLCGLHADEAHRVLEAADCSGLHNHPTQHDAVTGGQTLDG